MCAVCMMDCGHFVPALVSCGIVFKVLLQLSKFLFYACIVSSDQIFLNLIIFAKMILVSSNNTIAMSTLGLLSC